MSTVSVVDKWSCLSRNESLHLSFEFSVAVPGDLAMLVIVQPHRMRHREYTVEAESSL